MELQNVLQQRRSIRKYKQQPVEKEKIEIEDKLTKVRHDYSETTTSLSEAKADLRQLLKEGEETDARIEEGRNYIKTESPNIDKISAKLDKMEEKDVDLHSALLDVQAEIEEVEKMLDSDALKALKEKTAEFEDNIKRLNHDKMLANNDITVAQKEIDFNKTVIDTRHNDIKEAEKKNKGYAEDKIRLKDEIKVVEEELAQLNVLIEEISEKLKELQAERDKINGELLDLEKSKHLKESDIEKIGEQIESFKARRRELEPQLESAKQVLEETGVNINELEPSTISIEEINAKIQRLQKRMDELGDVNMRAISDFERVSARQAEMKEQIETLSKERKEILDRMSGYEQLKKEAFMKTFNNLNIHFKEAFANLAEGEGTLVLEKPEEPFEGGLSMNVQPRDKKLQRLESMSGGEKSITALAFVFAIQKYLPAPFYAFDEVDQSLDGINVEKLANLIQSQSKNTQFIVVSHRKPMIESANRTIGVTQKEKGITKVTGVKLRD